LKIAAKMAGLPPEEFAARQAAGKRLCGSCRLWKPTAEMGRDANRPDGIARRCLACRRVKVRTPKAPPSFRGRSHTPAARAAMSAAAKARPSNRLGRKHTQQSRNLISQRTRERAVRGPDAPGWVDGKGHERLGLRHTADLKRWRRDVYARDGYRCQHCGDARGGNLHAHHIKSFATHPELRFDVSNGLTLCKPCHKAEHR
jgi:hypothetical protein